MRLAQLFPLSAIALTLMACSPQGTDTTSQTSQGAPSTKEVEVSQLNESERLAAFFDDMHTQGLKRSPISQSYLGLKWDYGKWDDISDEFQNKTRELNLTRLAALNEFDKEQLSQQELLSLEIAKLSLQRALTNDEFRHHTYIMDQFRAWHTTVPSFLINIHRVEDKSDAEAYISRLQGVKPLFSQVIDQLRVREEMGVFPPKWSYDQMIQASKNVISDIPFEESTQDSTIWADFKEKVEALSLSKSESQDLLNRARLALNTQVKPAYESLIAELEEQQTLTPAGDGVWRLPDGDKWYQNRLNHFTTTDLNADQVHQLGLENVKRIHTQMEAIKEQVGFDGSLQAFFKFMRNDEQFYYPNTQEGRDKYLKEAMAYIDEMEKRIPEFFGLTPKAPMIVKRVEAFREQSAGKAFYQRPSADGSRPGIYYANLYDMNSMPTYQMEALAYHEGIPGHHMQLAIAQELEGVPEFQKYVSFTAYSEGWGLYTEELGKDMGFYQDPYSDFGRLAMELWRACRLVVDTGIHAKQWSREKAIDYLVENTPNSEYDATKAIERYIAMPGQATAYMIGKLKIMELRQAAKTELGDKFDIRGFHDEILKDGPVPLNILEDKIQNWVNSQKG
ncbi:DUF885 domain-containing protein [Aestuariibacter sp. AA17]|uniref:DUF885 domain-containing protein n=1 Tax=Fluctibacter corallii TaxID=2984329 RepID=A0ABT3AAR8_9ALTE|nr:DUF885 domain-containing protein [Aestuariibacter sp. AA17]MCV2885406.1 DUF885 domain-containing protein [Aestuariibacter sp. AA17]